MTRTRFNDAGPLIRLGRLAEAGRLLPECQQVFEDHADITALATVLSTRADLEDELGTGRPRRTSSGRRCGCATPGPSPATSRSATTTSPSTWGRRVGTGRGSGRTGWPPRCLFRLAGMTHDLADAVRALAAELPRKRYRDRPAVHGGGGDGGRGADRGRPAGRAARGPGTGPGAVEAALAEILRAAAALPPDEAPDIAGHLQRWEPVIAAIVAACRGDQDAAAELEPFLEQAAQAPEWAALAGVVRRILGGERDIVLLDGLDPVETASDPYPAGRRRV